MLAQRCNTGKFKSSLMRRSFDLGFELRRGVHCKSRIIKEFAPVQIV
jgi:hypothetical protein